MRAALTAAGFALVLGGLVSCGGDDGGGGSSAGDNASTAGFCESFNGLFDTVVSEGTSGDSSAMIKALKAWAADLEEVGTPEDMPEDARRGFELFVDQAKEIDDDATLQDLESLGEELSADDEADGQAFTDWTRANCPLDLPSLDPEDLPTDPGEPESPWSGPPTTS